MDDLSKIVKELQDYPLHIHMAMTEVEELRQKWAAIQARRDYEFAGEFLKAKAADFTEGEARQKATQVVYLTEGESIAAESAYRKAFADQAKLENEFAAVRKIANLHEASILKLGTALATI